MSAVSAGPGPEADAEAAAYYIPYYASSNFKGLTNSNAKFGNKFSNFRSNYLRESQQPAYNNQGKPFNKQPFNNFNQKSAYNQQPFNNFNQESAYNQQPFNNFNQESAYNQREYNQQPLNNFNQESAYNQREYNQQPLNNFNQESAYDQREYNQQSFNNFNKQSTYNPNEYNQQSFNNFNKQSAYNPKEYNKQTGSDFDAEEVKGVFRTLLNKLITLKVEDYSNKQPSYNSVNQQSAFKPKEYNQQETGSKNLNQGALASGLIGGLFKSLSNIKAEDYSNKQPSYNNNNQGPISNTRSN